MKQPLLMTRCSVCGCKSFSAHPGEVCGKVWGFQSVGSVMRGEPNPNPPCPGKMKRVK